MDPIVGQSLSTSVNRVLSHGLAQGSACRALGSASASSRAPPVATGAFATADGSANRKPLLPGSIAERIPAEDRVAPDGQPLTTYQRGFPRDAMCDIGAFEVQP